VRQYHFIVGLPKITCSSITESESESDYKKTDDDKIVICMLGIRPLSFLCYIPPITHVPTFLEVGRKYMSQSKKQFFSERTIGVAAAAAAVVAVDDREWEDFRGEALD